MEDAKASLSEQGIVPSYLFLRLKFLKLRASTMKWYYSLRLKGDSHLY